MDDQLNRRCSCYREATVCQARAGVMITLVLAVLPSIGANSQASSEPMPCPSAEPMPSPTREEAIHSEWIVIGEYVGYTTSSDISYFRGPIARYLVLDTLKGDRIAGTIRVRYEFHDGSACLPLEHWRFSDEAMPEQRSRWILFLNGLIEDAQVYTTYRGSYGRWIASEDNKRQLQEFLKSTQVTTP